MHSHPPPTCTQPYPANPQQSYIRPSGCMLPGFGSPTGPTVVECSGPGLSFTKTFAVADRTCAGASLSTDPTPNTDQVNNPLPSYACSKGADNSASATRPPTNSLCTPRPRSPAPSPPLPPPPQSTTSRSASLDPQMPSTLALALAPLLPWFKAPLQKPPAPPPAQRWQPSTYAP
jgi:hypothetical protein